MLDAAAPAAPAAALPPYLEIRGGRVLMHGRDIAMFAQERGTPLFLYALDHIENTARHIVETCRAVDPGTRLCYASKALSAIRVLRRVRATGSLVEVNSGGELFRARKAGFAPEEIVFNGVSKSKQEIAEALSPPILAINVDSLFELSRVAEVARELNRHANVVLRIVPGVATSTSPGNQTGTEATKFGIAQTELPDALGISRNAGDALNLTGLHCHIGSQILDVEAYRSAAMRMAEIFQDVQRETGKPLLHLNIGGGFPLPYMTKDRQWQAGIFSPEIDTRDILSTVLPDLRRAIGPTAMILVEPGRRVVGDSAVMLSRIENAKSRAGLKWLYADAGYNTLVESYTYKWYYHCINASRPDAELQPYRLAGPLCDGGDVFHDVDGEQTARRVLQHFPELAPKTDELTQLLVRMPPSRWLAKGSAPGDVLVFLNAGAYTLDQLTPNNGRPRAEVGIVEPDGSYSILKARDSYEDLLFNETV